jgi:ribosomal protein S18 acetylase RimI-like enzyme
MLLIQRVIHLPVDRLSNVLAESQQEEFRNIHRLLEDWKAGINRFNRPGEALFIAEQNDHLVGVCGLNTDPYSSVPGVGRVRRLYVLPECRRSGIGRALVAEVIIHARSHFNWLHVRTNNPIGDRFFQSLGFVVDANEAHFTHKLNLQLRDRSDSPVHTP